MGGLGELRNGNGETARGKGEEFGISEFVDGRGDSGEGRG